MSSSTGTVIFDDATLQAVEIVADTVTLNNFSVSSTTSLQQATNVSNVTTNTVEFTNPTTAFVTTGNVGVGTTSPRSILDINDTGAIIIPVGTTVEQPGTTQTGMVRYNTTKKSLEFYNGVAWAVLGGVSASGGTETTSGQYKIHTFTTSGNFVVYSGGTVEYLLVGGGGGGSSGNQGRAAGGGGGVLIGSISIEPGTHVITVGDGGVGGLVNANNPTDGNNTSAFNLIAYGGGKGANADGATGNSGGCGGGGGNTGSTTLFGEGGFGYMGQGQPGGRGGNTTTPTGGYKGGGGGGAGEPGEGIERRLADTLGLNGGKGKECAISGTSTYYGGGGGGGVIWSSWTNAMTGGIGGAGGGGDGGSSSGVSGTTNVGDAFDGTDGLGGGGGGGGYISAGGDGGNGIVIIRYLS